MVDEASGSTIIYHTRRICYYCVPEMKSEACFLRQRVFLIEDSGFHDEDRTQGDRMDVSMCGPNVIPGPVCFIELLVPSRAVDIEVGLL